MNGLLSPLYNGASISLSTLHPADNDSFFQMLPEAINDGWHVSSYFGVPHDTGAELYCVLTSKSDGVIGVARTSVDKSFPSLAEACPQLQLFEREIAEQCALTPERHPWLKPVRFHRPFGKERSYWHDLDGNGLLPGVMPYYQVEGAEVHEVAVGPVHAGVIEPGHFRFQCHGEEVFSLEISLGFQHRGIEQAMIGGPYPETMYQMEAIAGDTTIGHAQAYCMAIETLAGGRVPPHAEVVRGIALELERLANHAGDLGAIAGDVGYLPTASFCGRIRGDFLNMSAVICGSRFGRGVVRPGGVGFACVQRQADELLERLAAVRDDLANAVELLWSTPSVMARLEDVGTVSADTAREIGATQASAFERTGRSTVADFSAPSLVVLRLRALFGVGARAEVMRAFLTDPSERLSAADIAVEAGYTKRNIAEALEALRMAGLLMVHALRNQRLYSLAAAGWLTTLPGGLPDSYPAWSSMFRILEGLMTGLRRTKTLTARARHVEAADVLRDLSSDLQEVGLRLTTEQQGPDAWTTLERLAVNLSRAWASGSFTTLRDSTDDERL